MDNPLLSIIVPVYNVEAFLDKCVNSIIHQSFPNFELILIDDGSTDNSGKMCDEYAERDIRVIVVHKENGGQSSARNLGLDIAKGEYITFVDSDDYISDDCYEENMSLLIKDKTIDILEFPIYVVNNESIKEMLIPRYHEGTHFYSPKEAFLFWSNDGIGVRGFVVQNIYKKNLWGLARFKEGVIFEDCLIQSVILEKASHIYISGTGKYFYVQREGSTLHSSFSIKKWRDDFNATIPFLHKMVQYGVDRKYINRFYCLTLNRILDKSYLCGIDSFLPQIEDINRTNVNIIAIITSKINVKQKIKLVASKLLGVYRYLRITRLLLNRNPVYHD